MFNQIELTCFRQHRSLTVNFTPGLNAIRGANEAGKTSIFEAIAYALFGARALRETLAETVTWGAKETELRVRLWLTLEDAELLVTRSKSGAAVWIVGAAEPFVTGQDAVKEYFEGCFKAKADTAGRMMIASQQALQGALQDGPGAAVKLIETLANFSLIDRIMALAQDKLPNGNTKAVKERIELLEGQLGDEPPDPTLPLAEADKAAHSRFSQADRARKAASLAWSEFQPQAQAAEVTLKDYRAAIEASERAAAAVEQRKKELEAITVPPCPAEAYIAELRRQAEDAGRVAKMRAAKTAVDALGEPEEQWSGDASSLMQAVTAARLKESKATEEVRRLSVEITRLEGQLIKETTCAFCDKDLSEVPEVLQRNSRLGELIEDHKAQLAEAQRAKQVGKTDAALFQDVLNEGDRRDRLMSQHREFLTVDENFVPANYSYSGPKLPRQEGTDWVAELRRAMQQVADFQRAEGKQEQAQSAYRTACLLAVTVQGEVIDKSSEAEAAKAVLEKAGDLSLALAEAESDCAIYKDEWRQTTQALTAARALYDQQKAFRDSIKQQLKDAKKEFKDMSATNALIAKLRSARPKIADELWSIVNSGVGKVFSDIRGVPSVVTREDNDFKVDGHGIRGLSGSTLDAFGLAVRVSLTNTFLPHTDFLMLDEPAAAADAERERNMLGMIAASGFDQVLLVTHSDQCESFATNVVRI